MCQLQQFVTWDARFCHMEDQKVFFADTITTVCHMGSKLEGCFADVLEVS